MTASNGIEPWSKRQLAVTCQSLVGSRPLITRIVNYQLIRQASGERTTMYA